MEKSGEENRVEMRIEWRREEWSGVDWSRAVETSRVEEYFKVA